MRRLGPSALAGSAMACRDSPLGLRRCSASTSAICTALRAAPLRRLSPTTNSDSPWGTVSSRRTLPTRDRRHRSPRAGSGCRRARRPARLARARVASSGLNGRSNSRLSARLCPVKTGTRTQVHETLSSARPRILRLSSRNFCSSCRLAAPVFDELARHRDDVEGDRGGELRRRRQLDGISVMGERRRALGHLADLLVELGRPGQAGAGDGLVGGSYYTAQARQLVEGLQHRHRDHGRAVRVGDDALWDRGQEPPVDLRDDEGDVRVHPPGRGVVDDDGAGGRHLGGEVQRGRRRRRRTRRCRCRRSRPPRRLRRRCPARAEAEGAPGGAGAGEKAHPVERERRARRAPTS